ncbi:glycosyltransferase family 4 protein [Candidatus Igneacidithiobacillus taiwanensis]|uniref:glycosyltransferase family 4 protein n=1 Tax=Candidatus Igneacidithiobacillus taiwanensis TaxID=1945924 RepID=UPI0028987AB5|nr:glycosyltransferase family 4 protein [Candidatus Igneacidithiobacillus taiwanensis]
MRITFLLPGRGWKPVGGVKVVYEYANCLAQKGHEVTVVHPALLNTDTPISQYPKKFIRYMQAQVDRSYLPKDWFLVDPRVKMLWTWSLHPKYIPDADVIIATAWQTAEWLARYPERKGRKFYLIQHWENWNGTPQDRLTNTWRHPLQKIVIARWLEEIAVRLGTTAEYIPNGLDFTRFGVDIPIEQRHPASVFMLYHEQEWKGSADGIEALQIVKSHTPELRASLFGTSPRNRHLPKWIEYHRLPSPSLLRRLYNQSSIFLSPSWAEGWPLPPAEAMQCGAAVVATDIGGHQEFIENGVNGLLRPPKDPFALADAVSYLIKNPDIRIKYAVSGHSSIQQFTWERACSRLGKVLSGSERL